MFKVLVNDGIEESGKVMMEEAGLTVIMDTVAQDDLVAQLNNYDVICVRSATKVRKEHIDAAPNLKAIARGGVGLDNIDVAYAKSKGIAVINTPAASSRSVAELVMAHLYSCVRFLYDANRKMPNKGVAEFGGLKKAYAAGTELEGKTLGVIGMGRIGQEAIKLAIGNGMNVIAHDPYTNEVSVKVGNTTHSIDVKITSSSKDTLLANADFITLHVPSLDTPAIGKAEFAMMKDGVIIVNAARGGVIDEDALLLALESGKVAAAGLDVFVGEPSPRADLLAHPRISTTPHIGASTNEAQEKIGADLAGQVIDALKKHQ